MEALLDVAFYLFAALILFSAAVVAFTKNVMHAAFSLLFTLFGVGAFFVLLGADFLAITQVMIYIGGILVLIIFGVMLTSKLTDLRIVAGPTGKVQLGIMGALVLVVAIGLIWIYTSDNWYDSHKAQVVAEAQIDAAKASPDYADKIFNARETNKNWFEQTAKSYNPANVDPDSEDYVPGSTLLIGQLLLTDYVIAFEAASVLLLIAIVGAALIAGRRK